MQTQGLDTNSSVIVNYQIDKENLNNTYVQLKLGGSVINPLTSIDKQEPIVLGSQTYNQCGNYQIDIETGITSLLVTGHSNCILEANIAYSVKMRSIMDVNYTEFMSNHSVDDFKSALASMIDVPANNIVIIDFFEGSVISDFYITADPQESA
mmetsp:Transcript_23838/g.20806  ORF Transcript_23838/g.20806 Transcript_23838/m.20806 type:complete len:153 (+) Transcript_23838:2386-2844(+)